MTASPVGQCRSGLQNILKGIFLQRSYQIQIGDIVPSTFTRVRAMGPNLLVIAGAAVSLSV